ncbi:hypothetical protein [Nonomuraea lactucae]|uniref:hypothetical protein n=1 Tax=Nonomuraea lactucae TaxID=2249762 RepID=UPI0013B476AA|nr:hypothetical protein [Nonomuraea lactucae]
MDVGGGDGTVLSAIPRDNPGVSGVLFDRDAVEAVIGLPLDMAMLVCRRHRMPSRPWD